MRNARDVQIYCQLKTLHARQVVKLIGSEIRLFIPPSTAYEMFSGSKRSAYSSLTQMRNAFSVID